MKLVLKQIRKEINKTTNLLFCLTCTNKTKDGVAGSVDKNSLKLAASKQTVIRSENSTALDNKRGIYDDSLPDGSVQ